MLEERPGYLSILSTENGINGHLKKQARWMQPKNVGKQESQMFVRQFISKSTFLCV